MHRRASAGVAPPFLAEPQKTSIPDSIINIFGLKKYVGSKLSTLLHFQPIYFHKVKNKFDFSKIQ
jgi:hypothetical protein